MIEWRMWKMVRLHRMMDRRINTGYHTRVLVLLVINLLVRLVRARQADSEITYMLNVEFCSVTSGTCQVSNVQRGQLSVEHIFRKNERHTSKTNVFFSASDTLR